MTFRFKLDSLLRKSLLSSQRGLISIKQKGRGGRRPKKYDSEKNLVIVIDTWNSMKTDWKPIKPSKIYYKKKPLAS